MRIHTRAMRAAGALSDDGQHFIDSLDDDGLPATAEHFSGAELAGLVRSAASFSLSRSCTLNPKPYTLARSGTH